MTQQATASDVFQATASDVFTAFKAWRERNENTYQRARLVIYNDGSGGVEVYDPTFVASTDHYRYALDWGLNFYGALRSLMPPRAVAVGDTVIIGRQRFAVTYVYDDGQVRITNGPENRNLAYLSRDQLEESDESTRQHGVWFVE